MHGTNILNGVSTLDEFCKSIRTASLLLIMTVFCASIYAGHSVLDLVDPSFNPQIQTNAFNSKKVNCLLVLADGKILALGEFNSYNRHPVGNLIRLNANGSLDTTFDNDRIASYTSSGAPKSIILQPDGKIILIGTTITVNGQAAPPKNIVRLNVDGSFDASFNYTLGGSIQRASLDSVGRLALSGNFQVNENGTPTNREVVRLNADGSHDTSFTFNPTTSPFFVRITTQNSRVIVAVSASNTTQIYRLNENGSADPTFTPSQLGGFTNIRMIVQPDNRILVLLNQSILRLNENGGNDGSFQSPTFTSASDATFDLANDGKIVLTTGPDNATLFRRFLANGTLDPSFNSYVHPAYLSFAIQPDGGVVIGDAAVANNGTTVVNSFGRLFSNGTTDSSFNSGGIGFQTMVPGNVWSIALQTDGKILIAGRFDEVNATGRAKIARLNADDGTLDASFQINTTNTGNYFSEIIQIYNVRAQMDGKIIVTGNFRYFLDGISRRNIVRLNAGGSIDPSFNPSFGLNEYYGANGAGTNKFLTYNDGKILVGNSRISAGALPIKITADGAIDGAFNSTIFNTAGLVYIYDIALQPDGKIVIGGRYDLNNVVRSFVARLNADGSTDATFQISEEIDREVSALALLPNGKILVVKGSRNWSTPVLPSLVLRLNSDGSADNSFDAGTGANGRINTILLHPAGRIFVGGKFTSVNGQARQNLAQLNTNGGVNPITYDLNDEVLCLAADSNGRVLVGGSFTIISAGGGNAGGGAANRSYVARLIDSNLAPARTRFDFDGDGRADIGIFSSLSRTWSILNSQSNQTVSTQFGLGSDRIAPADFDGDGKADIAVYRPSEGNWYLLQSTAGFSVVRFGASVDKPVPADYDGDGKDDIAVWRPNTGDWWILQSSNGQSRFEHFGAMGDIPLPKVDFDGDGTSDIAVWRPSDGVFYWLASGSGNQFLALHFGQQGDIPAPADYNGDGKADLVVFRPSEGNWYQYLSIPGGQYQFSVTRFGLQGDEPVAADYNGDGKTDIALRRNGVWHFLLSGQGYSVVTYGNPAAQAVAALPSEVTIAKPNKK